MAASFCSGTVGVAVVVLDEGDDPAAAAEELLAVELALAPELSPATSIAAKLIVFVCGAGVSAVLPELVLAPWADAPAAGFADAAELEDAGVAAASEAFAGPSSALAVWLAIAARTIAAIKPLLRHLRLLELSRCFIQSMPPRKLLKASRPDPIALENNHIIAN
jgi:hypothetical protein